MHVLKISTGEPSLCCVVGSREETPLSCRVCVGCWSSRHTAAVMRLSSDPIICEKPVWIAEVISEWIAVVISLSSPCCSHGSRMASTAFCLSAQVREWWKYLLKLPMTRYQTWTTGCRLHARFSQSLLACPALPRSHANSV